MPLRGGEGGCSIPNALNLEKLGVKIDNCVLLLNFIALFCYTARLPLFSRISPDEDADKMVCLCCIKTLLLCFVINVFRKEFHDLEDWILNPGPLYFTSLPESSGLRLK